MSSNRKKVLSNAIGNLISPGGRSFRAEPSSPPMLSVPMEPIAPVLLSGATLHIAFPFHILIDDTLTIRSVGQSLAAILSTPIQGEVLTRHFDIERSGEGNTSLPGFAALAVLGRTGVRLASRYTSLRLRGQFLPLQPGDSGGEQLLFVGTPGVSSLSDLETLGLRLDNFAPQDYMAEYLLAQGAQQSAQAEVRDMAKQLKQLLDQINTWGNQLSHANVRLNESESRYQVLLDNLGQVVFQTDAAGYFTLLNQAWQAITNYSVEDSLGRRFADFLLPQERAIHEAELHALLSGERDECRYVVRCVCADGDGSNLQDIRWLGVNIQRTYGTDGLSTGVAGTLTDISERKRAERERANALEERSKALREREQALEALRANEAYLSSVVTNAPIVLFALNKWGIYTLSEGRALEKMGLPPGAFVGQSIYEIFPDAGDLAETIQRVVDGETVTRVLNWDALTFEVQLSPLRDGGDEVQGIIGIAIDISERREAEERLKAIAVDLQNSNQALQDFATIASHDLQEPLRKIQAFGSRLHGSLANRLTEQEYGYLERMLSSAGLMQTLINDLLTFSQVLAQVAPLAVVDMNVVLKRVMSDMEPLLRETGGRIEVDKLPTIDANPLQIRQMVQNLLSNSLKFRREGVPPVVRVTSELFDEGGLMQCYLVFTDNGIGFEQKYSQRIFEVFERLHNRSDYEGTGMGLAICKRIVERHGGTITARSATGEGATFVVTLPLKSPLADSRFAGEARTLGEPHAGLSEEAPIRSLIALTEQPTRRPFYGATLNDLTLAPGKTILEEKAE